MPRKLPGTSGTARSGCRSPDRPKGPQFTRPSVRHQRRHAGVLHAGVCLTALDRLISGWSEVANSWHLPRDLPWGNRRSDFMNKHDLIDAISGQLGSKKAATDAVNALLDTIQLTVAKGDKVAITGFGVFEKTVRPARTARNPATGATIRVPKSSVPKFRAGADFKAVVNGDKKMPARKP